MKFPPFLLDQWMDGYEFASPPIRYNLASSTGPVWTLAELMALGGAKALHTLDSVRLCYVLPQGTAELRQRIAEFHDIDPDWVIVTTGASEALSAIFALTASPGASIALPLPGYPAFEAMAKAWGLGVRTYGLHREQGFAQNADLVLAAVDATTRLVVINTPHNPTGSVMAPAEIEKLARALDDRGIALLVDEVFHPLYFGQSASSAARLPNTIVIGDASKALSLSGLRVGWLIDRDAHRREQLINVRSYFTICGSPLTEAIATHALIHRGSILARLNEVALANLAALDEFMAHHCTLLQWVRPRGGTMAFPWRTDGGNTRPLCEALARAGVLVVPGDCYGIPDHFRLGFALETEGFSEALKAASAVLATN
jgi:aspartate/methionine/tyrosine aminotransferase